MTRPDTGDSYVLPEDVFEACKLVQPSAEDEIQLSEAVGLLAHFEYTLETVRLSHDSRPGFLPHPKKRTCTLKIASEQERRRN